MKISFYIVLACAVAVIFAVAGCSQPAQPQPTFTTVPTTVPTVPPTVVMTPVPTMPTPVPTTVAPAIPLPKTIKDTQLLFTISAPDGYAGTTIRTKTSDYSITFKTTLFDPALSGNNGTVDDNSGNYIELPDSLTIFSYSSSFSVDQNIRNIIRGSGAVSTESSVTYNGISYTRFDVASDPYSGKAGETIVFVGDKGSANENGFLPVMIYTLTPDSTMTKATYENMVASFQYYTKRNIGTAPGEETDRPSFYQ
jgi:hypothetical protein